MVNYANYITGVTYADAKKRSKDSGRVTPEVLDIFGSAITDIDKSAVEGLEMKGNPLGPT